MPIERPYCPRCKTRMMLARISPEPDRQEKRTFECPKCDFAQTVTVADPLKSDATRWLSSELRPPE
jgi:transposase-like protein